MPKRIAKFLLASLTLAASAALLACATTPGPPNMQVQGPWRLDSGASDDVAARIASAIRTAQAKQRKHRAFGEGDEAAAAGGSGPGGGGRRSGGPSGGAGGGGDGDSATAEDQGADLGADLGAGGVIGPDFQELRARLQQTLDSSRTLTFKVQPDDVQIQRDDLPARDYQPGEIITRFDEYGTAQLKAAWKHGAFLLSERYTSGARLTERYALDAHGALLYTRSLRDPTVGKLQIQSVYRRTGP